MHDERDVEDVLEPLGEDKGNHVADVHAVAAGSAAGVEVKGLLLLVAVEDEVKLAVDMLVSTRLVLENTRRPHRWEKKVPRRRSR